MQNSFAPFAERIEADYGLWEKIIANPIQSAGAEGSDNG